jgi:hypothetical protein
MPRAAHAAVVAGIVAAAAACVRRDPPAPDAAPSIALPEMAAPPATSSATAPTADMPPSPSASSSPLPSSSAAPAASATAQDVLAQTHDRPEASGEAFDTRAAGLWASIVTDDPEKAMAFFFPLGAYQQVKDISDPASDWKRRLVAAYARDIHALHARLGDAAARAVWVGLDVPEARARWVDPGEEYNKVGYFRVFGSRLRYTVDGEARALEVKSLISWRGQWYVVHLSAFK